MGKGGSVNQKNIDINPAQVEMHVTQLLLLGKVEYGGGLIFKVVLEC